jgi:hypothetical protein
VGFGVCEELLDRTDPVWAVSIMGGMASFLGREGERRSSTTAVNGDTVTVLETPLGPLRRVTRSDPVRETTWAIEDFFKETSDIEKFLSVQYEPAEPNLDEYRSASLLVGHRAAIFARIPSAINMPAGWFDPETFNILSVEERDTILDLLETVNRRIVDQVLRAAEMDTEYFWMYGPEYAGPPLMHPRCYDIFSRPFDQEIAEAIHAHGGILHTHMHGRVWEVLDSLTQSGTDVISPLEAPPMGNVHLPDVLARYGDRSAFMGNLDDYAVIGSGNLELVRKRVREAVIARNDTKGSLLLGGTDGTPVDTQEMAQAYLEMGRLSRELSSPL